MHHGDHRWRGQTDHLLEASELSCTSFSCTCALTLLQTRLLIERKHPIAELCGKFPFVLFEICISSTLVCDVYSKICLIFRLLGCYQYKITLKCKRCPPHLCRHARLPGPARLDSQSIRQFRAERLTGHRNNRFGYSL